MSEHQWLAEQFERNRGHLRAVAYRMLGSLSEAEDAIQDAWLKVSRADVSSIENLSGWLTTVVSRVSLDMLRTRTSRREEAFDAQLPEATSIRDAAANPEQEALLANSVGIALLVVLDTLDPAERLAFVLHDMFGMPFDEIGPIVGRSTDAARQLASRARRRVRGAERVPALELTRQREVVDAFLTALRGGDFEGLLSVLDPDVVVRVDAVAGAPGQSREIRGARNWVRGALAFSRAVRFARPALIDGHVGIVLAHHGRLSRALRLTIRGGSIVEVDVIADPLRLRALEIATLEE